MSQRVSIDELGELQREVMEIVWDLVEASVAQVRKRVNDLRREKLAYTTILTVMQKLESAKWLTHRTEGRTYIYRGLRSREEAGIASVRSFLDRVFGGDPRAMFQHMLKDQELSNAELLELKKMIDDHRKERLE